MTIIQSLQKRNLYRFDPIAYWLLEKWHVSPLVFGVLSIPISTGLYLLAAWISGTLWSTPTQVGLLQDWLPWVWPVFINPIILGYYLWSFQAIDQVIQDLVLSDVLALDESEIKTINQTAWNTYQIKGRKILSLSSTVFFSALAFMTRFELKHSWTGSHILPILVFTAVTLVVVYMGTVLVLNLVSNIWILHIILKKQLKKKEFNINPLHPDRCGGLRSLSDYALKTAYLAAVLGIMVGFIEYQFITQGTGKIYWFVHLFIPFHILLSTICFFGPLLAAHRGMRSAKEQLLREIAKQFQADYLQIHSSLTSDAEALKKGAEKISELRAFYTLTDEFPVWPFDIQTFRRFLLTLSTSILPLLGGIIGSHISCKFLNQNKES